MAPMRADVKVVLTVEISPELKALLTAQGWTPPGETPPARESHVPLEHHDRALNALEGSHHKAMARLREQHKEDLAALERVKQEALKRQRAEVAEEIAKDLEKPREWRISPEKPNPWAVIARKHAGGKPEQLPFPPDQITWSGPACAAFGCTLHLGCR